MREVGMGIVGWTPDVFWASTPEELEDAFSGLSEKSGWKKRVKGMSRKRLNELMKEYPD
jgi:uncharacterized phage protein (TIGR02216 family)